ncbi:nuclear pore complex protein NUP98B-like isoform X1 [Solanum tuberosum]|uniref:nuclear pore complex protein NUP98B-like isoform X1 n=1 Tax=Solanum tuberosum TaxID=4113 RepID=UPI00073A29A9|nr:PREDICTED: nuclear pore complex protein NUP98B-like isoform X1 [Solanum tuberosum]XP_015165056.1 PREDICTED: nuclear pore complex protein NUP98B-like isoform X1 [Solanum tuberosum]
MTNRCMAALDAENYLQEIGAQEGSYFPRIMEVNPSPIMPPAFPRIMEVNPSPITPPAETQPSVQISVEHLNLATSIQYGISSLPVSNNPTTIRRKSSLIIRHSSLSQHMLPPKYKPTSDIPKVKSWILCETCLVVCGMLWLMD